MRSVLVEFVEQEASPINPSQALDGGMDSAYGVAERQTRRKAGTSAADKLCADLDQIAFRCKVPDPLTEWADGRAAERRKAGRPFS